MGVVDTLYLMQEGNTFNRNIKTYYCESDYELSNIPANEPAGTMAEVNKSGDFHIMVKKHGGGWNRM